MESGGAAYDFRGIEIKRKQYKDQFKLKETVKKEIKKRKSMELKPGKQQRKINIIKSCFFQNINKIYKLLARLTKERGEKREKTLIANIRSERKDHCY